MGAGTQIRLGGSRIDLAAGGTIHDAAEFLEAMTRANIRGMIGDPALREEAIRRVLSPPCAARCYVRQGPGGAEHDCYCPSGFQYASDEEKEALDSCEARDTWSDLRSLIGAHKARGGTAAEPIVCDCDCMTPAALSVAAYLAWIAGDPSQFKIAGEPAQAHPLGDKARFAIAITHPKNAPIAHAYGLTNYPPPAPQPEIKIGGDWYVWDAAAHWGMKRPENSFYPNGKVVAYELRRDGLEGLVL